MREKSKTAEHIIAIINDEKRFEIKPKAEGGLITFVKNQLNKIQKWFKTGEVKCETK